MDQPTNPSDLPYACRRCDRACEEEDGLCADCVNDDKDTLLEDSYRDEELYN